MGLQELHKHATKFIIMEKYKVPGIMIFALIFFIVAFIRSVNSGVMWKIYLSGIALVGFAILTIMSSRGIFK